MATVPPPPSKRQKVAADAAKEEAEEAMRIPENLGSVRVQFEDASSGAATGTPISIPISQATTKNLEHLLNDLKGVCTLSIGIFPFLSFSVTQKAPVTRQINDSLE